MTLTLPTPDAGDTARQRFALELLLQQPVPGPEQLLASRNLLSDALPDVSPELPAFTRLLVDLSALLRSTASLYAIGVILLGI